MRLFHRSTRSVSLTQEGEIFLESCRKIVSEMESIEHKFAQQGETPSGKLRVSLPLLCTFFVPVLKQFMQAFPSIELDLDFGDCGVDLIEDGYDIAVHIGRGDDSRLMSKYLGSYRLVIVGAPEYFARAGTPIVPSDLSRHVCMHHKCQTTGRLEPWPLVHTSARDFTVPVSAAASTHEPLIQFAECGAGITCLPDFSIRRQLLDGSLVQILDNYVDHADEFRAVWPSSRHLAPKTRVFVDFIAKNLLAE